MVNSTSSFIEKLKSFVFKTGDVLVSFDVVSLFTNVPLSETIELITDFLYSHKSKVRPPLPKSNFKKLLTCATSGLFMYKDKVYQQTDGVTMGNPLGPTLANFFMANIESKIFESPSCDHPRFYVRYVDDIFAVFSFDTDFSRFLNILNKQHPNISFTYEGNCDSLPFLDTEIKIDGQTFRSEVYRKKTNTNLILNYKAVCPRGWKSGLVYCLLNRAWKVCSDRRLFDIESKKLWQIFSMNGYAKSFYDRILESFIQKQISQTPKCGDDQDKRRFICKIPYVGKCSSIFANKLSTIFKEHFSCDISCVYTSCKVGNYFSLKCQTPAALVSNVVYKYTCLRDAILFYIGKTKRHFDTRVAEHLDFTSEKPTGIAAHVGTCVDCQSGPLKTISKLSRNVIPILIAKYMKLFSFKNLILN